MGEKESLWRDSSTTTSDSFFAHLDTSTAVKYNGPESIQHEIPFDEAELIKLGRKPTIDDLLNHMK